MLSVVDQFYTVFAGEVSSVVCRICRVCVDLCRVAGVVPLAGSVSWIQRSHASVGEILNDSGSQLNCHSLVQLTRECAAKTRNTVYSNAQTVIYLFHHQIRVSRRG